MLLTLLFACAPHLDGEARPDCADGDNAWVRTDASVVGLQAEGYELGQRPPDFCQQDQNGDTVSLYQFYGHPLVLDVSAGFCGPCQNLAGEIGVTQADYKAHGLVYMSVLPQDFDSAPATVEFVATWEQEFMVDEERPDLGTESIAPVIADRDLWSYPITERDFPELLLLDEELRIVAELDPSDYGVRSGLDDYFGISE